MASNNETFVCGFDGNPDLTGLGVRSAFYIQTLSLVIAGMFLDAEAGHLHSSIIGLLLAVLVALLRETIRGSLFAPEVSVILWLFSLQLFSSFGTVRKLIPCGKQKISVAALLPVCLHLLLVFAYIGYAIWFWFVGLDSLPHTACTEWAFFFAKVNVRGWFRTFNKVSLGLGMVCSTCGLCVLFVLRARAFLFIKKAIRHLRGTPQKQKPVAPTPTQSDEQLSERVSSSFDNQMNMQDPLQHSSLPKRVAILVILSKLWVALRASASIGLMAISVELQIEWNQIHNVQSLGSVSQLIPFIVALGQFAHIAYSTIREGDRIYYLSAIADAVGPRPWKEVREIVTPSPCPERGDYQSNEEEHEMIVATEGT
ncbi:hypothetical protein BKA59DRAFT_484663 [Fusarium tricinctum]|uniref:Uncharacterized protein n=1 Tax=Fusarium tricinctum TaxID=61284 RepID=A0A8K0W954_9HYPO|nr:hypothetical protein BKA59DRAFT_484663 [Fusarium tricinctum]